LFFSAKTFHKIHYSYLVFDIIFPLPDYSNGYYDTLILQVVYIELIFMSDICLEVATIFLWKCCEYLSEIFFETLYKFSELECKVLSFIWYSYDFFTDTIGMEVFFADALSDELVSRDHEHPTCTISITILAEDTDREYPDIDNLPLYIPYSDSVTDMILPENEEECQNREDKILQRNDKRTKSHREEAKTTPRLESYDNENNRNNW
jgi:hypothetical protein